MDVGAIRCQNNLVQSKTNLEVFPQIFRFSGGPPRSRVHFDRDFQRRRSDRAGDSLVRHDL